MKEITTTAVHTLHTLVEAIYGIIKCTLLLPTINTIIIIIIRLFIHTRCYIMLRTYIHEYAYTHESSSCLIYTLYSQTIPLHKNYYKTKTSNASYRNTLTHVV